MLHGACPSCGGEGCTLAGAARAGRDECVRRCLARGALLDECAPLDDHTPDGLALTPLMHACRAGHATCAALLIGASADVDARLDDDVSASFGRTALAYAAAEGHAACARALLAARCAVDAAGWLGKSALHEACDGRAERETECAEVVALLVQHGARVELRDALSDTPLLVCARAGRAPALRELLAAHADPSVRNAALRESALEVACGRAQSEAHACVARLLVEARAGVNAAADGAPPPLARACDALSLIHI